MRETVGWLLREMRHPGGAFFAALDADSEGEEGKFYLWRRERIKRLLSEDEYLVVATLYGIDKPAISSATGTCTAVMLALGG